MVNLTLLPHQGELIPKQNEEILPQDTRVSPCHPLKGWQGETLERVVKTRKYSQRLSSEGKEILY